MIKKFLYLFAGIIMMSSCYGIPDEITAAEPDNLIPREKLILILTDVELAESALRQKQNTGEEIGNIQEVYYYTIFKSHDVSKEQFDSSMLYYKQDVEMMDKIYEDVITRLSLIESEAQMESEAPTESEEKVK